MAAKTTISGVPTMRVEMLVRFDPQAVPVGIECAKGVDDDADEIVGHGINGNQHAGKASPLTSPAGIIQISLRVPGRAMISAPAIRSTPVMTRFYPTGSHRARAEDRFVLCSKKDRFVPCARDFSVYGNGGSMP